MKDVRSFTPADYKALADVLAVLRKLPRDSAVTSEGETSLAELASAIKNRTVDAYLEHLAGQVPIAYHRGLKLADIFQSLMESGNTVIDGLFAAYPKDMERVRNGAAAYRKLRDNLASVVGETYAALEAQSVAEESGKVIRELSTPVIEVWDDVIVMPIVGTVDSRRAQHITEALLERLAVLGSRVVILDVTGVSSMDTGVANHLLDITRAARLLGAHCIMVGISPSVAQTLVKLQVDLASLETYAVLHAGLARAFSLLGYSVQRKDAR